MIIQSILRHPRENCKKF